jgi:hypothetical protein
VPEDLDPGHLARINAAIMQGQARHIFVSAGVARLMVASKAFPWLRRAPDALAPLRRFYSDGTRTVYQHLHLSNYGKFEERMVLEARAIQALLPHAH